MPIPGVNMRDLLTGAANLYNECKSLANITEKVIDTVNETVKPTIMAEAKENIRPRTNWQHVEYMYLDSQEKMIEVQADGFMLIRSVSESDHVDIDPCDENGNFFRAVTQTTTGTIFINGIGMIMIPVSAGDKFKPLPKSVLSRSVVVSFFPYIEPTTSGV